MLACHRPLTFSCVSLCVLFLGVFHILSFVSAIEPLSESEHVMLFEHWQRQHSKVYANEQERSHRFSIFRRNLEYIRLRNTQVSFRLALNHFSDLTFEEFKQRMLSPLGSRADEQCSLTGSEHASHQSIRDLPTHVDWRSKGAVTRVKDQGNCGSCWSFSSTGSLEGAHFLKSGHLVSLSEQNLIDCSKPFGNNGCDGGLMPFSFQYILSSHGIDTEESYPYQSGSGRDDFPCRFGQAGRRIGASIRSYVNITRFDELDLQRAIVDRPVSVAIDVTDDFMHYSSGVYRSTECGKLPSQLNHGVLAVGYGVTESGEEYYTIKNSWSANWGNEGYIWIARNADNMCGIATCSSYPIA